MFCEQINCSQTIKTNKVTQKPVLFIKVNKLYHLKFEEMGINTVCTMKLNIDGNINTNKYIINLYNK